MSHGVHLATDFLTVNLIRHAQSENNALEKRLRQQYFTVEEFWKHYEEQRSDDPPLSSVGREQAGILAKHLSTIKLSNPLRLFCSALHRSIDTANIIGRSLGVPTELWVDIFEEGGYYLASDPTPRAGKTNDEIRALGVKIPDEFKDGVIAHATDKGWWNHPRETQEESVARAKNVVKRLKELATFYAGQRMNFWLVAHGDFLSTLLFVMFGSEFAGDHKSAYLYHDNCGVTQIAINGHGEVKTNFINRRILCK